ncbi:cholinesterase 1-like [Neocloeon triangulifer]|uniref:cholinesterase 1-like n=1 Tax=Neocloeon triangulifer TaxID=2078957 RepID=UPI00286ED8EE|nr:cholinesterase 1-like [Neocloeon triangulifer]
MDCKRCTYEMQCTVYSILLLVNLACGQIPQVTLPCLGTMEGYTENSYINQRLFYHFRGVPFAQPPIGDLRFQAPQTVQPWVGILDAQTSFGSRCSQFRPLGRDESTPNFDLEGITSQPVEDDSEDCLFLQVYTPTLETTANLPVIVFIHGGGFTTGSSRLYGGDKFMDHDVVLVVPHYRLGPLGFLSLQTDEIPGNAGLLDQVEALKWVQRYIRFFGGNPSQVTVMGESAGAVSTTFLNLSPLSSNLFNQFISQSGSALAYWATDLDPVRSAFQIGAFAGCNDTEINAFTECLKTVDAQTLSLAYLAHAAIELKEGRSGLGGITPVVQKAGAVRFIEKFPAEIYKSGEYNAKPAIIGANKHEGTIFYNLIYKTHLENNGLLNDTEYFKRGLTRHVLSYFDIQDQGDTLAIAVEKTYFGAENMGNLTAMTPRLIDYLSNMYMKGPAFGTAEFNAAKGAPTYLYSFHYQGSNTMYPVFAPNSPIPGGVCHADELILQFSFPNLTTNVLDDTVANKIVSLWANFATYGDPTAVGSTPIEGIPSWPAWTNIDGSYLIINATSTVAQDFTASDYFVSINENFPLSFV